MTGFLHAKNLIAKDSTKWTFKEKTGTVDAFAASVVNGRNGISAAKQRGPSMAMAPSVIPVTQHRQRLDISAIQVNTKKEPEDGMHPIRIKMVLRKLTTKGIKNGQSKTRNG